LDDISARKALLLPSLLAAAANALAAAISLKTGVEGSRLFYSYVSTWSAVSLIAILIWVFVEIARLALVRADRPLQQVWGCAGRPVQSIALPALIFPSFLGGYTWAKCSIPLVVGYRWERTWSDVDRLLLGSDAWQITHSIFSPSSALAWTYFYAVGWGFVLVSSGALIAVFASRRFAATFFTSMMLSWLIGGVLIAYAISAAGPVFAHLVDPEVGVRFAPLREHLVTLLGNENFVLRSQRYLAAGMNAKTALQGHGVSAMPSMHIATATVLVLAAWRTRWLLLAASFLLLTFIGSVHLGYHYAVDAPVAALIAWLCWRAASRLYGDRQSGGSSPSSMIGMAKSAAADRWADVEPSQRS
jgi:hypothetical protein